MARRPVVPAISLGILALAAGMTAVDIQVERHVAARLQDAGLTASSVSARMMTGRIEIEGITRGTDGWRVSVGRVSLPHPFGLALPARAATDLSLRDVKAGGQTFSLTVPRIDVAGSSLDETTLRQLFAGDGATLSQRLAAFSATSLTVPEAIVEQRAGGERQVTTYREVRAVGIRAGMVERMAGTGGSIVVSGSPERAGQGAFGAWYVAEIDGPAIARVFNETGPETAPMATLYGAHGLETFRLAFGAGNEAQVARITGSGFKARPAQRPLAGIVAMLEKDPDSLSEAEQKEVAAATFALLANVEFGTSEATGIRVIGVDGGKRAVIDIARMLMTGGSRTSFEMTGTRIEADKARVGIDVVAVRDLDLGSTIAAARDAASQPAGTGDVDAKRLIPRVGAIELVGVDVDIPADRPRAEPVRGKLGRFAIAFPATLDNIPTAIRVDLTGLSFSLPARTTDTTLQTLKDLGYSQVDLSMTIEGAWDEASKEFRVSRIGAGGLDMAQISISGTLGNVSRDVFSGDAALMQIAALGATAKALDIVVEDKGLTGRWLAFDARKQRKSVDALRRDYGSAAAMLAPAVLGPGEASRTVGTALGRFIAKPGTLKLNVRTRDPQGIGFADVMMSGDPTAIVQQLEIQAASE